jgi:hypothetical protein
MYYSSAAQYRAAQKALHSLAPFVSKGESWKGIFLNLLDSDIHGMTVGEEGESEGHRSLSWIWKQNGVTSLTDDSDMHECKKSPIMVSLSANVLSKALCVEWCKSRARAMRWTEETLLLLEEMRRMLHFLDWQAHFWVERSKILDTDDVPAEYSTANLVRSRTLASERKEGVCAYALRQAAIRNHLRNHFKNLWRGVPALVMSTAVHDLNVNVDLGSEMKKELVESSSILQTHVS